MKLYLSEKGITVESEAWKFGAALLVFILLMAVIRLTADIMQTRQVKHLVNGATTCYQVQRDQLYGPVDCEKE